MATGKIGLIIWLSLATVLWALHPLLFAYTRGTFLLAAATVALALLGWANGSQALVFWSGMIGLLNLTLALLLAGHPPNLWVGLSAGLTLFALLDGGHRWTAVRRARVESGMLTSMLDIFVRISGLSVGLGFCMGVVLVTLGPQVVDKSFISVLTLGGACLFAGFFTVFLLYTNRTSGQ